MRLVNVILLFAWVGIAAMDMASHRYMHALACAVIISQIVRIDLLERACVRGQ